MMRAEVLHWKNGNRPGIRTEGGAITDWPNDAPFPEPD